LNNQVKTWALFYKTNENGSFLSCSNHHLVKIKDQFDITRLSLEKHEPGGLFLQTIYQHFINNPHDLNNRTIIH